MVEEQNEANYNSSWGGREAQLAAQGAQKGKESTEAGA